MHLAEYFGGVSLLFASRSLSALIGPFKEPAIQALNRVCESFICECMRLRSPVQLRSQLYRHYTGCVSLLFVRVYAAALASPIKEPAIQALFTSTKHKFS